MPNRRTTLLALALSPALRPAAAAPSPPPVLSVGIRKVRRDFDLPALEALPQRTLATSTPWYPGPRRFTGPLVRDVLGSAGLPADATGHARCVALNDYRVDIPLVDLRSFDVVLAHRIDGKPIGVRDKGPLFVIYPFEERPELRNSLYYGRCIWQLKSIEWV